MNTVGFWQHALFWFDNLGGYVLLCCMNCSARRALVAMERRNP